LNDDREERRTYLGGPDVAAILGLSPYQAPIDVWRFKLGFDEGQGQTERMRLGQLLEQAIADAYSEQTGRQLRRVGLVRHKQYPFLGGHPDRLVVGERGIFEAKASASARGYSDDDLPPHVRVQVTWYTGLVGRDWADVVLLAGMGLRIIRVDHDPELFEQMVTAAVEWWQRHVVGRVEPEPDGTESYRRHLAEKFPIESGETLVATAEQQLLADELRQATVATKAAEAHEKALRNRLAAAMGEASVMVGPGFKFTYSHVRGKPAWKAIAEEAGAPPELIAKHTPEGARQFRTYFAALTEEEAA